MFRSPQVVASPSLAEVPASPPLSERLSKDLRAEGFRFVGPVDRPSPFFVAVDVVAALRAGAAHQLFLGRAPQVADRDDRHVLAGRRGRLIVFGHGVLSGK